MLKSLLRNTLHQTLLLAKAKELYSVLFFSLGNGGNYRAGQVIPHDALLNYQCPGEAKRDPNKPPLQCKLGHLVPSNPHCGVLGTSNTDWLGK